MNLSISNIAWNKEENDKALELLKKNNIHSIDIAPTLLFDSISEVTKEEINKKHQEYETKGITIVAMQSLLYGIPPYSIFGGETEQRYIFQHLGKIFFIAKELKIKNLVFGSPQNRKIKNNNQDNIKIAIKYFRKLCNLATNFKLNICLEANPKEYNCNFITNTFEAVDFIKKVNKKNFLLNLDTSTIILNKNNFKKAFTYSQEYIGHIHISSPNLKNIKKINHKEISKLLKDYNYQGYISLEMRPNLTKNNLKHLEKNIKILKKFYT